MFPPLVLQNNVAELEFSVAVVMLRCYDSVSMKVSIHQKRNLSSVQGLIMMCNSAPSPATDTREASLDFDNHKTCPESRRDEKSFNLNLPLHRLIYSTVYHLRK